MDVQKIKEQYPAGSWIMLTEDIEDPFRGQKKYSYGTVVNTDDIGTIHVNFGNRVFGVIPDIDSFIKIDPEKTGELKLHLVTGEIKEIEGHFFDDHGKFTFMYNGSTIIIPFSMAYEIFRGIEMYYLSNDAEYHIGSQVLEDVESGASDEDNAYLIREYGMDYCHLVEELADKCAQRFWSKRDCTLPDESVWDHIVSDELNILKKHHREVQNGGSVSA